MQRPDEKKRKHICEVAARLFASRPFHEVRLEDVASEAGVGKGTLYVYFQSKEDLYASIIFDGFSALVDRLREQIESDDRSSVENIRRIVRGLVAFAVSNPHINELMRNAVKCNQIKSPEFDAKRDELAKLIEQTIRRGVRRGEIHDPHPQITALLIPGMVRSVFLFGPRDVSQEVIGSQILRIIENGIVSKVNP